MQLTIEQRVFFVLNYQETKNYEIVRRHFEQNFLERISPTKKKPVKRTVQNLKNTEQLLIETKEIQEGNEPPEHRKTLKWYKMLLMRTPGQPFDEMKVECLPQLFIEY